MSMQCATLGQWSFVTTVVHICETNYYWNLPLSQKNCDYLMAHKPCVCQPQYIKCAFVLVGLRNTLCLTASVKWILILLGVLRKLHSLAFAMQLWLEMETYHCTIQPNVIAESSLASILNWKYSHFKNSCFTLISPDQKWHIIISWFYFYLYISFQLQLYSVSSQTFLQPLPISIP